MLALRGSAKSTDGTEDVTRYTRDVLGGLGYKEEGPFREAPPARSGNPRRTRAHGGHDGAEPSGTAGRAPRQPAPRRTRAGTADHARGRGNTEPPQRIQ